MGTPVKKTLLAFIFAFGSSWLTRMSGGSSVLLAIVSVFVDGIPVKMGMAVLAIVCFFSASFAVWRKERETIEDQQRQIQELGNKRKLKIAKLRDYYIEVDQFIRARFKEDGNEDEINDYVKKANDWIGSAHVWVKENLGKSAAAKLTDTSQIYAASICGVYNQRHSSVILNMEKYKENISTLIESDAWDELI